MRRGLSRLFVAAIVALSISCGDSPMRPGPVDPPPPPPPPPPANTVPVIESISVQGARRNQPANFADVAETVDVTAVVRDQETATDQLQYFWTANLGTVNGTGARVSWRAPASIQAPTAVTITLEVVERYGTNLEHRVTRTAPVSLHDSVKEVGDMARQFLLDFSDTNIKDAGVIMRNFSTPATCPEPGEVTAERDQVTSHYQNYRMLESRIGPANVSIDFRGSCPVPTGRRLGDACAFVPSYWRSVNLTTNKEEEVDGIDIVAAIYRPADTRWWLCASNYDGRSLRSTAASFYVR